MFNNLYVSLTSIKGNERSLYHTIKSIANQTVKPDKCFLYLSEEAYMLDSGFKDKKIDDDLLKLLRASMFEVVWVKNTGPYRKLLPLLQEKIDENCAIIAIDDDTGYAPDMIKNYVEYYKKYKCVIAARSFTMKFNSIEDINYKDRAELNRLHLYNFHTGKGGVLYCPKFFERTLDNIFNEEIYRECCPHGDDIWFNFHRIANDVKCFIPSEASFESDYTTMLALYRNFNMVNDNNTKQMRKTIKALQNLGYKL